MYVAKKVFIPMNLLIKMKFSLPCCLSTKGMVISLQLQKQDNNTHCVGRRMTGHNIVIMTDNCSFLFLLEAGAGGNNQYWMNCICFLDKSQNLKLKQSYYVLLQSKYRDTLSIVFIYNDTNGSIPFHIHVYMKMRKP